MPAPAERLALLMEAYGDSYRSVAERCGLDHTTVLRVARGQTENPETLAKIAVEGFGVPVAWFRGERDLACDFTFDVLSRPIQERITILWERDRRVAFALEFPLHYDPQRFTVGRLSELVQMPQSEVEVIRARGRGLVDRGNLEHLCAETGLPLHWFQTGLLGCEDEEELLVGLAAHALTALAEALVAGVSREEIQAAAHALV